VPPPIAGQGYAVTFQDQFDTLNPNVWTRSVWWNGAHGSDELYAAGGALHLVSRRSRGYPDIDTATYSPASGAPQKRTFRLGYFEARMKIPSGNGSWPAFWLYSKGQADGQTGPNLLNSEIDIADEGEGQRIHFAGVHKNTNSCCGVRDEIRPSENWRPLSYDMSANWHIFSALWTTSEVIFYIDEVEVMRAQAWPSTNQDHLLIIDEWIGGWGSPIDPTTPDVLDLQVDWVRVWQK
jgi:beta-glucanase (GH16 family)